MNQEIDVRYSFWPVGQGLFASGVLHCGPGTDRFHWVYDCGTSSPQKYVKQALESYRTRVLASDGHAKVDLVTISHFDNDHISGLVDLLSKFSIGTLLLPFMPLWERLIIAFENGVDTQHRFMNFYVDPVGFVGRAAGGQRVGQIIFVPPNGNDGPSEQDGDQLPRPDGPTLQGKFENDGQLNPEQRLLSGRSRNDRRLNVRFLVAGSRLVAKGIWEFVPYNDGNVKAKTGAKAIKIFQEEVDKHKDELVKSPNKAALGALRDLYDRRFGKSGLARNLISLFLYAGPIVIASQTTITYGRLRQYFGKLASSVWCWDSQKQWLWDSQKQSILYTGDGYLNTPKRLNQITSVLRQERIGSVCCMQVMHHGAEGNWHSGVAKKFSPDISVFSSDPAHGPMHHPHGSVARDFLGYQPIQVDKSNGFDLELYIRT
jgi:hypothetical protein